MSRVAQMALLAGKLAPAVLTYQGFVALSFSNSATGITAASRPIGTPSPDRIVFAVVHSGITGAARTLQSATIGGVSATIHVQATGLWDTPSYGGVAIISAAVPTGTTADVVLNYASGSASYTCFVATYSCTGLISSSPVDLFTNFSTGFSSHTENIDITKDGILLAASTIYWDDTSTLTGVTRNYNYKYASSQAVEGGSMNVSADELNHAVKFQVSGATNASMVGASFR